MFNIMFSQQRFIDPSCTGQTNLKKTTLLTFLKGLSHVRCFGHIQNHFDIEVNLKIVLYLDSNIKETGAHR